MACLRFGFTGLVFSCLVFPVLFWFAVYYGFVSAFALFVDLLFEGLVVDCFVVWLDCLRLFWFVL